MCPRKAKNSALRAGFYIGNPMYFVPKSQRIGAPRRILHSISFVCVHERLQNRRSVQIFLIHSEVPGFRPRNHGGANKGDFNNLLIVSGELKYSCSQSGWKDKGNLTVWARVWRGAAEPATAPHPAR